MTASELEKYFSDRTFFKDPDQEVEFVLSPGDVPFEKGTRIEIRGAVVPKSGEAVVAFRPAPTRKYRFSLKFEAYPVIEAESLEEAERKAYDMISQRQVVDPDTGAVDKSYVEQEPDLLGEVLR